MTVPGGGHWWASEEWEGARRAWFRAALCAEDPIEQRPLDKVRIRERASTRTQEHAH